MPFKSADGGRLNDEAFLRLLARDGASLQPRGKGARPGGAALADLPLVANDVVKVRQGHESASLGTSKVLTPGADSQRRAGLHTRHCSCHLQALRRANLG